LDCEKERGVIMEKLLTGGIPMTQTTQPCSWPSTSLNEPEKNYHIQKSIKKPEPEDNISIYLSLLDSLNALYKNLFKINCLAQKNNSLNVELPYLQEPQEITRLIQGEEIQDKEKGEPK
jgi:hypothetical protein